MKVTVEVDVPLTITQLAEMFSNLGDEDQAQFFIEVARIAATWPIGGGAVGPSYQWHLVGRHLRDCVCSTEEARDLVCDIARGIESR